MDNKFKLLQNYENIEKMVKRKEKSKKYDEKWNHKNKELKYLKDKTVKYIDLGTDEFNKIIKQVKNYVKNYCELAANLNAPTPAANDTNANDTNANDAVIVAAEPNTINGDAAPIAIKNGIICNPFFSDNNKSPSFNFFAFSKFKIIFESFN